MTFWNVTILMTRDDDAPSVTFDNEAAARRLADWARAQGAWFVSVWK